MNYSQMMEKAEMGNVSARLELARYITIEGYGDPNDARKIVAWTKELAEGGNSDGQFYLATMHRQSNHEIDAFTWYGKAALQHHPEAMSWVARYYLKGDLVDENQELAFNYANNAFELGDKRNAPEVLAIIYIKGEVVERDIKKAYQLLKLARSNGNTNVIDSIRQIEAAFPNIH